MANIRQPKQVRSIETKKKIIESGYVLFGREGFYNVNTAQIAKEAMLSTGIIYGYFNNKKEILIEVIELYNKRTYNPIFELLDDISNKTKIEQIIDDVLTLAEKLHREHFDIHKELNAVAQTDESINKIFIDRQKIITDKFLNKLKDLGYKNITCENIHLAMNLVESYVHEAVYDKHEYLNYNLLRQKVVELIKSLF